MLSIEAVHCLSFFYLSLRTTTNNGSIAQPTISCDMESNCDGGMESPERCEESISLRSTVAERVELEEVSD